MPNATALYEVSRGVVVVMQQGKTPMRNSVNTCPFIPWMMAPVRRARSKEFG